MRASRKVFGVLGLAIATVCVGSATADDRRHREEVVRARMVGYNEVPTLSSTGRGRFKAVIDEEAGTIEYTLSYQDLGSAVAQAHIHIGQRHTNGGIMVFLCTNAGNAPPGITVQACPAQPAEITGTLTAADVFGPAAQGVAAGEFAEVLQAIRAGSAYANVHTANFPAGEIRGQIERD